MIIFWLLLAAAALTLAIAYGCFRFAFYVPPRKPRDPDFVDLPEGKVYEPFWEDMTRWTLEVRALPHEQVSIRSFDGLTLTAKLYEYAPGAPVELMFHGYRGNAERDLSGGVQRCFALGRSVLMVDQRCSGNSQGNVITFGIHEHKDCLAWLEYLVRRFPERKIILTGISMGASTVMMAAGHPLPDNVIGVLADCGFTSARDIIQEVIRQMKLPPKLSYPFVKLGARLFGHFDLDECSSREALKRATVPVIFFHGEDDDFVPCYMSRENFEACASRKQLVTIPGAAHGLSYPVDPEKYLDALREFFGPEASHPDCNQKIPAT